MLIPELIKRAVVGEQRFDFIESSISMSDGKMLSSLKGEGHADPGDSCFHFRSRTPLPDKWKQYGDPANAGATPDSGLVFRADGIERGSASWTGIATGLRVIQGRAIHAKVSEWSRADERSVHLSFTRVVIPGRLGYPVTVRHSAGHNARMASIDWENVRIDFRDYDSYTEVCAYSSTELPVYFAESVVHVLGKMLDRQVGWIYRERHADNHRVISVKALSSGMRDGLSADTGPSSSNSTSSYQKFWQSCARELAALL
ncbi:MAG TPA: hypothetical protein VF275_00650 [Gammaproteobacteria bacterium]